MAGNRSLESGPSRRNDAASAWGAAAVVVAIAALGLALFANAQVSSLSDEVEDLQAQAAAPTSTPGEPVVRATESTVTTVIVATTAGERSAPLDPALAKTAITGAFETAYNGSETRDDRLKFVDDVAGVDAGLFSLMNGELAAFAVTSRAQVESITFNSASRATVRYSVLTVGQPPFRGLSGEARVVGGTWKVVRATFCGDLATFGSPCE